jgi:hypothetical protein
LRLALAIVDQLLWGDLGTMRTTLIRISATWYWLSFAIAVTLFAIAWMVSMGGEFEKGYGIKETGLYPIYPRGYY